MSRTAGIETVTPGENMSFSPLCGIEFSTTNNLKKFLRLNPALSHTTCLQVGEVKILLFRTSDFPIRDTQELFDRNGCLFARLLGPDALEFIYDIHDPSYTFPDD